MFSRESNASPRGSLFVDHTIELVIQGLATILVCCCARPTRKVLITTQSVANDRAEPDKRATNPHLRVAFLPWAPVRLKSLKFLVPASEPRTTGEHLRKRRSELRIWQSQAALNLGVSLQAYRDWEKDRATPSASPWKAVIAFLGHNPLPQPSSLAEQLRRRRLELGRAQGEAARRLGVAPETWQLWEADSGHPSPAYWARVIQFLAYDPNPEPKTPGQATRPHRRYFHP